MIARNIKSIKNFTNLLNNKKLGDLENLDGVGETQIRSIKKFFSNETNKKIINNLEKMLSISDAKIFDTEGKLKNKTFMLTGKLLNMSRSEAKSLIEQNSGSIITNVSNKLDYLIIGDKPTKRKIDDAKALKIKILNQSDWLKMLNKSS